MPTNKKISELTEKTTISADDEFIFVDKQTMHGPDSSDTGQTSIIKFSDLKNAVGSQGNPGPKGEPSSVAGAKGEPSSVAGDKGEPSSVAGAKGEPSSVAGPKGNAGEKGEDGSGTSSSVAGIVNVDDFGAVGDGETDDAPAFQSAIDSLASVYVMDELGDWAQYQDDIPWTAPMTLELAIKIYTIWRPAYANMSQQDILNGDPGIALTAERHKYVYEKVIAFVGAPENTDLPNPYVFDVKFHIESGGGKVVLGNKKYAIHSSVNVGMNVTIEGPHENPGAAKEIPGGTISVKDDAMIVLDSASSITGCYVMRYGITVNENDAQNFGGTGIKGIGYDVTVSNCFVGGFEYGIVVNWGPPAEYATPGDLPGTPGTGGRCRLRNLNMDNLNSVYLRESWDICYMHNIHTWPFLSQAGLNKNWEIGDNFQTYRNGTAFDLRGQQDWTKVTDCFSYGYKIGFNLDQGAHVLLKGCGADNISSYIWTANDIPNPDGLKVYPGTIGFNMGDNKDKSWNEFNKAWQADGGFHAPVIVECQAAAQEIGFNVKSTTYGQFSNCQTWCCETGLKLEGGGNISVNNSYFDSDGTDAMIGLKCVSGSINALGCGFKADRNVDKKYEGNVQSMFETGEQWDIPAPTPPTTPTSYPMNTLLKDNEPLVNCVYQQVLGRDPDSTGLAFWSSHEDETILGLVNALLDSDECKNNPGQCNDISGDDSFSC